jgi:Alr-MurF fusion protein
MIFYSITDIAAITGGQLIKKQDSYIRYLITDSRSLVTPAESLFFAVPGERHDGHKYISELYQRKLRNFVVSALPNEADYPEANFIVVDNTIHALQKLSAHHRKRFNYPVIGITGSNGKTVVKEWIFQALHADKKIVRNPKSYNSQVGVPLSVWLMDNDYNLAVFEAGMSKPGEMEKLNKIIQPKIGIFTNIGEAHQENFTSVEEKIDEKLKLFKGCKTLIYCKDYELLDERVKANPLLKKTILFTWSKNHDADLHIQSTSEEHSQTIVRAIFEHNPIDIIVPFIDKASIENAIQVWALMLFMGFSNDFVKDHIKNLTPVAMRLELKHGINNCTLINDSYNSDLNSLGIALDFLNQQNQHTTKTLILSDIFQSGKTEKELHEEVTSLIKKKHVTKFIGIGHSISTLRNAFDFESNFFETTDAFLQQFTKGQFNNEAILLKGSRPFEFERISHALEQKANRTALQINMNALIHNLNYFRSKLNARTRLMVMVKAFSYGSGTYEISNMLQFQRTDYLAVAFADEGIQLRESGIVLPILVMNPEATSFDLMINYALEPEIYNLKEFHLFREAAKRKGIKFPVHIKLDTGMHRLGFMENEIDELIQDIALSDEVSIKSIFTHLAGADDPIHDNFTREQIATFERMSSKIIHSVDYPVIRHVLNSPGIERFPEAQYDMVRLGIGLYGISSVDQSKLENVSTLISTITQIKQIKAGETIGYGRKGKAVTEITIAIIPIGYADGLNRKLSNGKGKFLINGKFAPIIGNICMDVCMADITGIEANEGDDVIVFGDEYSIIDMAAQLETIPYEILTGISSRVKRVYFQE